MLVQLVGVRESKGKRYAYVRLEDGQVGSVACAPEVTDQMREGWLRVRYYVVGGVVRAGVFVTQVGR